LVDSLGNPLHLLLTAGQCHDSPQARKLVQDWLDKGHYCLADKAYDSDDLLKLLAEHEVIPVIPASGRRAAKREYDTHLYKERHLVECFIGKIKHYRGIFTRYAKLDERYLAFLHFASTLIWLR
jgi:transposase